jgi:HEAT repeat protein
MKTAKILSLLLALMLVFSGMVLAQEKKDKEIYDSAKRSIYDKDWQAAIENLEYLIKTYQASNYLDDSLYWLGYSLHKMGDSLANMEGRLESKERSIAALNNLIARHKDSAWVDDARILRVKIAEDLVDNGLSDYRAYINGSLLTAEDLEELGEWERADILADELYVDAMELRSLGGALAYSTLDSLGGLLALENLSDLTILGSLDEGLAGLYSVESAYGAAADQYASALGTYEGLAVLGITSDQDEEEKDPELELKLVALQALLNVDSEKAYPILVKILQEDGNPKLRRNAIFVLSRSKHPDVASLMAKLATEDSDQEVRQQATLWLGKRKDTESLDLLFKIYNDTDDAKIKQIALFSLSQNKSDEAQEKLIAIARSEKDIKAREQAVFFLGQKRDEETVGLLISLYDRESDMRIKEKLIYGLGQNKKSKSAQAKLIAIAKGDKDSKAREHAIFWLGQNKNADLLPILVDMYNQSGETKVKNRLIMSIAQNKSKATVPTLIGIARKEKNPELQKTIIFFLGRSKDEAALKYLQEIIEK